MIPTPLVSVVIPVYNVERYLHECVDSVLGQSYSNLDVLLIDDGSKDSSAVVCDQYQEADSRVRTFHLQNGGVSVARNFGIAQAKGKYLLFLDSDDWIDVQTIQTLVERAEQEQSDLVMFGIQRHLPDGSITFSPSENGLFGSRTEIQRVLPRIVENVSFYSPVNKLYRLDIIKQKMRQWFPQGVSLGEDLLFNIEYFSHIAVLVLVSDCFYHYRIGVSDSLMKKFYANMKELYTMHYQALLGFYQHLAIDNKEAYDKLVDKFCEDLKNSILLCAKQPLPTSAKASYFHSVRQNDLFRCYARKHRFSGMQWLLVSLDIFLPIRIVYAFKQMMRRHA